MSRLVKFLIQRGVISKEQYAEAESVAKQKGEKPEKVLVALGYCTSEQVMQAIAELEGYSFVDLREVPIPPAVVELVPESVARENVVIPIEESDESLRVCLSDPNDFETIDKLQFILNRKIDIALATPESINEAINRNYGQMGDESADSMLQEFTDTAI
ncbi:MAG: type II/IV secretion system protein, partial [Planctomycetota bacterium]